MAAVTKSSGKYFFENGRVWREATETGVEPFFVGRLNHATYQLPHKPTPEVFRDLAEGHKVLNRVQANRVGCFDLTFTNHKSVSVTAYGLTPPDQQNVWARRFVRATRPEVERALARLELADGAQGRTRISAKGVAIGFNHRSSWLGTPQAHVHYAVPNVAVAVDGTAKSIANVRDAFYDAQAVMRARSQKGLDELFQKDRFVTAREGSMVTLANFPKAMLAELSPARAAMEEARAANGFTSARAYDFYARQARRDAGARVEKSPAEMHRDCTAVAKKYGVTIESLRLPPGQQPKILDRHQAKFAAFAAGKEALEYCAKRYGRFTEDQFLERLYTFGIGAPTTLRQLDKRAERVLSNPRVAGVRRVVTKEGQVLYTTARSERTTRKAEREYERATPRADAKPGVGDAWGEFVSATKGLGTAAFVATAQAATKVVKRVTEAVSPAARIVEIDAARLPQFVAGLKPTPFVKAHAKAIFRGMLNLGNPHQMAARAETEYARLRAHDRLDKNTVIVVRRGSLASARDLHALAKVARRDGCSVVLAERPERLRPLDRGRANAKHKGKPHGRQRDRSSED